jgi:hypothetical protein
VIAAAGISATVECPVPVARWQSVQEHMNIEAIRPLTDMVMLPQAHLAVAVTVGRLELLMAEGWHAPLGLASVTILPLAATVARVRPGQKGKAWRSIRAIRCTPND